MLGLMHGLHAQARKNLGFRGPNDRPWYIGDLTIPVQPCRCFICTEVAQLRDQVPLRMSNPCRACADTGIVVDDNGNEWSCYMCSSTFPSQSTNRLLETYTPP